MISNIRLATQQDARQITAIYEPIVKHTTISFEWEPPTVDEMARRIAQIGARLPWLVCERRGQILGYAYATAYRTRAAYQWCVEVSVYTHEQTRRKRVGQALYTSLFKILALQGYYNAYAIIALPNPASVGLHELLGFTPVGVYRQVGYKLNRWHDVGWWQLALQERTAEPQPPLPLDSVRSSAAWETALMAGLPLLRI